MKKRTLGKVFIMSYPSTLVVALAPMSYPLDAHLGLQPLRISLRKGIPCCTGHTVCCDKAQWIFSGALCAISSGGDSKFHVSEPAVGKLGSTMVVIN